MNASKDVVARFKDALSVEYCPPQRGIFGLAVDASTTRLHCTPAYFRAIPSEGGGKLLARTTVYPPWSSRGVWPLLLVFPRLCTLAFVPMVFGEWTLGVAEVLEGMKMLERETAKG